MQRSWRSSATVAADFRVRERELWLRVLDGAQFQQESPFRWFIVPCAFGRTGLPHSGFGVREVLGSTYGGILRQTGDAQRGPNCFRVILHSVILNLSRW